MDKDKIALLAESFTTDDLISALDQRLKNLADNYIKVPKQDIMQFSFEMSVEELRSLRRASTLGKAFRQETMRRFIEHTRDSDLSQYVFDREFEFPVGDSGVPMRVRRGTITFIRSKGEL